MILGNAIFYLLEGNYRGVYPIVESDCFVGSQL